MTASIVDGGAGWLAHLLVKTANNWWDRSQCSQSMFSLVTWLVPLASLHAHLPLPPLNAAPLPPRPSFFFHSSASKSFQFRVGYPEVCCFCLSKVPGGLNYLRLISLLHLFAPLSPLINPAKSCALAFSIPAFDRTLILTSFVTLDH
jgi:hypothetical protein